LILSSYDDMRCSSLSLSPFVRVPSLEGSPIRRATRQGSEYPFLRETRDSPAWPLDQIGLQSQPGQVGAAAAAGLVPDPVQVRADGAGRSHRSG
jgi:hypothetical protein